MDKAVEFPAADRGGNSRTHRKDFPATRLTDGSRETHHKMVVKLTLQAIHMLLACQSIIEFLQTNGDKMLFSRESDAELWKIYLSRVSKRGTYSVNQCREELALYFQDIERGLSEKLSRLGSPMLEKAIKEMQDLSLSLGSFVDFGGVCVFADDELGLTSYRLFSEPGKKRFDFVDKWEVQINEIAARNRDSILGDKDELEKGDLQFRRTYLDLALAMKKIAAQFAHFARKSGSGSSVKFEELYASNPLGSRTATRTQARREEPREEPNLTFLTAPQDSEYKARFVALVDEGSHVISREKTTKAIQRLNIHPRSVAHIWQAVGDVTSSNELYFPEFALAMYLGNELREGRSIPLKLPPTIKKNVEDRVNFVVANIAQNTSNTWASKHRQNTDGEILRNGQQEEEEEQPSAQLPQGAELQRRINEVRENVKRAITEMTEGDHCYVSGDEEDQPSATGLWVWKDVELGRRINEVSEQVKHAMLEMTEGDHVCISDEETSESLPVEIPWTPSRGSSIRETHRLNDQETEISERVELQTTIKGTQGETLEVEGGAKHIEPSFAKNTLSDIPVRNGDLESEAVLIDLDGILLRAHEDKLLQDGEQERQAEDAAHAKLKLLRDMEEDEKRVHKAAAEAEFELRRHFEEEERRALRAAAAAEAEAEERRQSVEAQQKPEADTQRQQEARLRDQEGFDESTGGLFLDSVENLVMPREETERNIIASTSEGDNSQIVDISPQSERPGTFDSQEEDSRRQTLTKRRETPNPSTGEGTATGTQMPQHRQMELLGHQDDRNQTPSPQLRIQRQQTPNSDLSSISGSRTIPDLVRDSKLETAFAPNGQVVRHVSYVTNPRMRRRRVRKEEIWERQSELGSGAFGRVWLEKCATGDDIGKLRAVKEITKLQRQSRSSEIDYNRELEAIAKFSHKKVCH
jgi:hypothetical protein